MEKRKGHNADCSVDFKYGMKRDFNAWLATLGAAAPIKTLTDLRYFNIANAGRGAIKYGQSLLDISDEMDVDKARYEADRAKDIKLAGTHGIDEVMKAERLDAILFPGASGAAIAARPGYPDGHRPVRAGAERADAGVPGRLRREAVAVRRQLHRHGVQRAAAHRAGVRVRAGPPPPPSLAHNFARRLLSREEGG